MAYILRKRDRFLTGHSYATGLGYRFHWSASEAEARRFTDDDPSTDTFARQTDAKVLHRPNTRAELRAMGRRLTKQEAA